MKKFSPRLAGILIIVLLLLDGQPVAAQPESRPAPDLLVKINLPLESPDKRVPSRLNAAYHVAAEPLKRAVESTSRYDEKIRNVLIEHLAAVFHARGYRGEMARIEEATDLDRGKPILVIDLERWAISRQGRFDCQFAARLVTPLGTTALGRLEYSDISLRSVQVKGRDVAPGQATDAALEQFHAQLTAAGQLTLLPSPP